MCRFIFFKVSLFIFAQLNKLKLRVLKYFYLILWVRLIVFASLCNANSIPKIQLFEHFDKVVHFVMYFGASLFSIPFFTFHKNYKRSFLFAFFFSVLLGITMEILQYSITENRSADLFDVLANIFGSIVGIIVYQIFIKNRRIEKIFFRIWLLLPKLNNHQ